MLKGIIVLFIDIFMRIYNQNYRGRVSISFSIILAIKLRKKINRKKKEVMMFRWNKNDNIMKIDINYVKQVKCGMKTTKLSKHVVE